MLRTKVESAYMQKLDEFLPTLIYIFTMARWFGIPTYGGKIAFYCAVVMLAMLASLEIGALWKLARLLGGIAVSVAEGRGLIGRLSGSIFYGNALISLILSWRLISCWKRNISLHWMKAETTGGVLFPPDVRIRRRVIYVTSFVAVCACVEHTMSMISSTGFNIPPGEYFHLYVLNSHGFLLQPHEYSIWLAVPIFILSKLATILWNFQDLIIILISMGLTSRYHRMNLYVSYMVKIDKRDKDVKKVNNFQSYGTELYIQVHTWRRLREAYVRQAALVRIVDRKIGTLVLLSNMNNLYFICLQIFLGLNNEQGGVVNRSMYYVYPIGWLLFRACGLVLAAADVKVHSRRVLNEQGDVVNRMYYVYSMGWLLFRACGVVLAAADVKVLSRRVLNEQGDVVNRVYYVYSMGWLLFRACGVVLAAADVNVHSRRALPVLYECPGSAYNVEIKRLKNQLVHDTVAITGMGMFSMHRKLLLEVAAAILKYELVILQYDKIK